MTRLLLIGAGGFVGSISRYLVSGYVQGDRLSFPYGTLAVNLMGCFLIGFLSQLADSRGLFTPESRSLVFIGFLGGFTTFSTFGNETMNLLRDGQNSLALGNTTLHLIGGLAMVWLGRLVSGRIWQ